MSKTKVYYSDDLVREYAEPQGIRDLSDPQIEAYKVGDLFVHIVDKVISETEFQATGEKLQNVISPTGILSVGVRNGKYFPLYVGSVVLFAWQNLLSFCSRFFAICD